MNVAFYGEILEDRVRHFNRTFVTRYYVRHRTVLLYVRYLRETGPICFCRLQVLQLMQNTYNHQHHS